ncbi:MgtC/SapB family protein [Duganella vulcania]|uniref:DUF4010 domain-containing protein n=1 Tax=Duganella vulcania TaxID=2692166 RepID=A0A845GW20_9BURK|nr:DUF4010 domain-containing protein [Duganella vulcania]MYM97570.1 DUF4010 domain-containing protein [Duganella vulcania]
MSISANLIGLGAALGSGMLIGIERERRKGEASAHALAGVRSFALVALCGALAQTIDPALTLMAALMVVALNVVGYYRASAQESGMVTQLALFASFLLGVNAVGHPQLSAGLAVLVASMLNLRAPLHHFIRVTLKSGELRDGLILAGAALVIWPLLPDAANSWLLGVNPRRMWGLVVVLMALQAVAHVAMRMAGPRMGLALTGLASGFVSSVAATADMGRRYRRDPSLLGACAAAALLSNVATYLLLFVVVLTIAPGQLLSLAPTLACALLATALVSAALLRAASTPVRPPARGGRVFSIRQAVLFALILSGATALMAYANAYLGTAAATLGALLVGLVDLHAAASSILSLADSGVLTPAAARHILLCALAANTSSKLAAAAAGGGRLFLRRVGWGLVAILLAASLPSLLASW